MRTIEELEATLAQPSARLIGDLKQIDGDIMILGAGGKMGPSLAKLLVNATRELGLSKNIYAVSRFSVAGLQDELASVGVETIAADLLDEHQLASLPNVENIIYMAGLKFGTVGNEHLTWAMNTYLPGRVAAKYKDSRIVAFSTGNVYPLVPTVTGGATEDMVPNPVGEYAQSCLGRERILEYFSRSNHTPMTIFRLNYAIDMRYGVLLEIAKAVHQRHPIDLSMGQVNVIWQGDANEFAIRSLTVCDTPPKIFNVTGPESASVRYVATEFGKQFGKEPQFEGVESSHSLLNNAALAHKLFGYPRVPLLEMIEWIGEWVQNGGVDWNKPTHFQEREGTF